MTALEAAVREIRNAGVHAVAVVTREGTVLAADLPPGITRETFSIMCATIFGAGTTVSTEMGRTSPRRIVLESDDGRIVISEAGRRALLVLVLALDADIGNVTREMQPFVEQIARETA